MQRKKTVEDCYFMKGDASKWEVIGDDAFVGNPAIIGGVQG